MKPAMFCGNMWSFAMASNLVVPEKCMGLVRLLYDLINQQEQGLRSVSQRSGVSSSTIHSWRYRRSPTVTNFQAVLNSLGYELVIRRREDV